MGNLSSIKISNSLNKCTDYEICYTGKFLLNNVHENFSVRKVLLISHNTLDRFGNFKIFLYPLV